MKNSPPLETLNFNGKLVSGEFSIKNSNMLCIPSKAQYEEVSLAMKCNNFSISVCDVTSSELNFEEKKNLGFEIARRWNLIDKTEKLEAALNTILKLSSGKDENLIANKEHIQDMITEALNEQR